jgi:ABC-type amino acid transport substrate-binding protein
LTTVRLRTAAAALAVAAVGGTIFAVTAAAAPVPAGTTISFREVNLSDRTFNLGSAHGFAVGFVELVADKLMQGGKQVGHDGQSDTVTRLGSGSADEVVSSVEVLARGQIDLSGLVTSTSAGPGTFRLAVTGGTGTYEDARGYATVVPSSTPTVTIHLTA